jgi:peptidoglycan hydrolase FlgJ
VSISPVSDIVFDVAMASDPAKYQAAAEKLSTGSAGSYVEKNRFDLVLRNTVASVPDTRNNNFGTQSLAGPKPPKSADESKKAYKGVEQLVLKNLVETLLPKNSSVLFGSSTAGDVWRSLLADHLASEIGKTVELGTARRKFVVIEPASREGNVNLHLSSSDARLHSPV